MYLLTYLLTYSIDARYVTCLCRCDRLLDTAQQLKFTCRVVHSIPLLMSAVQVFYTEQMVAVSHLIGTDQLPTSKMVWRRLCDDLCIFNSRPSNWAPRPVKTPRK